MAADRAVRAGHGGLVARPAPDGHRSQSRREGPRGGTKPASLPALGTAAGPGGAPARGRRCRRRRRLGPGERKKNIRVRVSKEKNRLALLFLRTQRSAVGFVWTDEIKSGGELSWADSTLGLSGPGGQAALGRARMCCARPSELRAQYGPRAISPSGLLTKFESRNVSIFQKPFFNDSLMNLIIFVLHSILHQCVYYLENTEYNNSSEY